MTWETLRPLFHLSLREASERLGMCSTSLKRECRKLGIKRWPYRQIKKYKASLQRMERSLSSRLTTRETKVYKNGYTPSEEIVLRSKAQIQKSRRILNELYAEGDLSTEFGASTAGIPGTTFESDIKIEHRKTKDANAKKNVSTNNKRRTDSQGQLRSKKDGRDTQVWSSRLSPSALRVPKQEGKDPRQSRCRAVAKRKREWEVDPNKVDEVPQAGAEGSKRNHGVLELKPKVKTVERQICKDIIACATWKQELKQVPVRMKCAKQKGITFDSNQERKGIPEGTARSDEGILVPKYPLFPSQDVMRGEDLRFIWN